MKLIEMINERGIENCMFMVPMRPVRSCLGIISYTSSSDFGSVKPFIDLCKKTQNKIKTGE